jgi:hypothetical protein
MQVAAHSFEEESSNIENERLHQAPLTTTYEYSR